MKKKEEQLQISLDRVKLQKHVYELCRVQKLTINEVRKKTGLGMGTIYRYLHTFEEENPKLVEQMKNKVQTSFLKTIRNFKRRFSASSVN